MASKFCIKCEDTKLTNEFQRRSLSRDGLQSYCKSCSKKYVQQWKKNNRDHVNEQYRNRYATNPQVKINKSMHDRIH